MQAGRGLAVGRQEAAASEASASAATHARGRGEVALRNPVWERLSWCPGGRIQPKLKVGRADDPLEREADRVADQFAWHDGAPASPAMATGSMQRSLPVSGRIQRKCAACEAENQDLTIQAKLEIGPADDPFEREADRIAAQVIDQSGPSTEGDRVTNVLQTKPAAMHSVTAASERSLPSLVNDVLTSPGQPLDATVGRHVGQFFGCSFANVRVHTDSRAAESAARLHAHAYTVGHHLVFGAGQYAPRTANGLGLLAHELTHVVQQRGAPERAVAGQRHIQRCRPQGMVVQRQTHGGVVGSTSPDFIELCFVPIRAFYLGHVGGVHAILNIHHGARVTRVEVDPNYHQAAADPGAVGAGPMRRAGVHSHVAIASTARSVGSCQILAVTAAGASAAVTAARRYESLDVAYEPPGLGPNSNSFGEWVLHEAGVNTAAITTPAGALGWDWYQSNPGQRAAPPRVARIFTATQAVCSLPSARVRTFRALVDLVRRIETQLITCGMTDVGARLSLLRGIFYGGPWARDYGTSQGSHARNQMFNLYSGTPQPRNPLECIDCGSFLSLGASQDLTDGGRRVDVGHMLIGMDARRSRIARTVTQPIGQVTGLEATTWAGDLGGGAARLAMARRTVATTPATNFFVGTDYGGSINLEGDVAGYAVAASSLTSGSAPALAIPPGGGVADALETYLIGQPATAGRTAVPPGWNSRCTIFLTAVGGTFDASGALTNRAAVHAYLAEQIHDFACWYMVTFQSRHPLTGAQMVEASRHMDGAAAEMAEVFLAALERCHSSPMRPLAAGSAPVPTPIGEPSCALVLAPVQAREAIDEALDRGGALLDRARREGEQLMNDADRWIEQRRREAQGWWERL